MEVSGRTAAGMSRTIPELDKSSKTNLRNETALKHGDELWYTTHGLPMTYGHFLP